MFAGPNGSGKSRLNNYVNKKWLGIYVNADEIEKQLPSEGVSLSTFKVELDDDAFIEDFNNECRHRKLELPAIECKNGIVKVDKKEVNSYYASMIAELIRGYLLIHKISFTFETVMSHESKVAFLILAKEEGFKTYLYFIATEDPRINISRVAKRVMKGGHDVPVDKIESRYHRAIELLPLALKTVDRGYVFDNSGTEVEWIAETSNSESNDVTSLELKTVELPHWMRKVVEVR
ncbi:MAG: hypothetical protein ACSHX6_02290 [Akkermansiaceae bacterium]